MLGVDGVPSRLAPVDGPPVLIRSLFVRSVPAGHTIAPHIHQVLQWYHCFDGRLQVTIDGTVHALCPGEAVLVPPGAVRAMDFPAAARYLVCIADDLLLGCGVACGRVLALPPESAPSADLLARELDTPGGLESSLLCRSLVVSCLIHLRRQALRGGGRAPAVPLADEIDAMIRRNLHRPLTRADLAAALGWSEATLARRYRAATGCTVHQRITALRLARARQMLGESDLSVEMVAGECGFASTSHFTALFRAACGCGPGAWRRSQTAVHG